VQVSVEPPTIVLKCNDAVLFDEAWKRYLVGYLREALPFKEVPLKVYYRSQGEQLAVREAKEEREVALEIDDDQLFDDNDDLD
jgi:GTP-binding protein